MTDHSAEALPPEVRRGQIMALLQRHGQISVKWCAEQLGVSEVTIRSDFALLEREGTLRRIWGGAVLDRPLWPEGSFASRLKVRAEEKERIARAAARLINDGDTVMLDASTTAYAIARQIAGRRNLTVITNGMHLALSLGAHPAITTIVIGGQVRGDTGSLTGTLAEEMLQRLHADKGFFSARGLTLAKGLTESSIPEGLLKAAMVRHVDQVIAVLDSSKLGVSSLTSFCPVEAIHRLITAGADAAERSAPFGDLFPVMIAE
ncbi:MAG: DeoR/GlpR transcriptional regulator [Roseiflexus castenholzii]|uniref:DeoR/GlpR family DNA-binding transcription regulator n=1 Tax=Roseiflexus castenholzii TaxID=120962 RepID=UPI000CC9D862|nr:MAG: DeoR/GlpR transcriptional regulator [Roseiflexus castenholzii]